MVTGELFATWWRTVYGCERQTVYGFRPDCPPVKNIKTHSETKGSGVLDPDSRTVRRPGADCPRIAQTDEQSTPKIASSL
jgi:hypothetical protein